MVKKRLDHILVARGLAENPTRARAAIMAGLVFAHGKRLDKPGQPVPDDIVLERRGRPHPWVSRGGIKLARGLDAFALDPAGWTAIDVGASTGGFTDVLLSRGAVRVYAVDVGRGQLAWKLRTDDRVVVLERTNARDLTRDLIPEPVDAVVCDASFIGLRTVLPAALAHIAPGGHLIALIKPQFELGRDRVGKNGVVRAPECHAEACETIRAWLSARPGWTVLGIAESPVKGPKGNTEFLIGGRFEG